MTILNSHLHQFDPQQFGTLDELRNSARSGREQLLLIACADHGNGPDHLSIADPSRLSVVQNMATSIPSAGEQRSLTTLASIEYAVALRNARHVIVCGHLNCNIISRWLTSGRKSTADLPVRQQLRRAWSALQQVCAGIPAHRRREVILRDHVLRQVVNLRSHEFIRSRLDDGRLRLHAWVVDDKTARVDAYEPSLRQFRTLEATAADCPERRRPDWSRAPS